MLDSAPEIEKQIAQCMLQAQPELRRSLQKLQRRIQRQQPIDRDLQRLSEQITLSTRQRQQRLQNLPLPQYTQDLPVVARRDEIRDAIERNQVVIVCGETGSGKTTQLPKICLELGRGVAGMIGHTQPRRIAARSLSARIAEELHSQVGRAVGYKVRFNDQISAESYIKVMTDGILLAETQSDPDLLGYDTLIIDEAHERSLNIDFILGYLKGLLPKRPDLKVIITSATIDPQRFAGHFNDAPIIQVSGRTYPVDVLYRPLRGDNDDDRDRDRGQALLDAVDELVRYGPGDILVFLAGERDIREAAELLRKHHPAETEIVPLYGRLSTEQQNRVFQPHRGRRIVLATNVAETSLTVPGIRYVIDTGVARISRYNYRTKVQRLPIEPVSQASANQRAGRCGRVEAGICIRLYSEEDFQQRPLFTDPEIQRTNLAAVILQMLPLKLGDIGDFPFIDPPDARLVNDGFKLLYEIGAIDEQQILTAMGRQLARLPVDVRLGRMILAAEKNHCLNEILIIVSALAVQDPRDRPFNMQQQADEKHAAFVDKNSDFIGYLKLWDFYQQQARHLSQAKLRKLCQNHFLSYVRMREWVETHKQLHSLVKELQLKFNQAEADYDQLHRSLLSGLLGNIAVADSEHEYLGTRNLKLYLFPGSGLFKKKPKWIVAAELVETAKRYARTIAKIEPEWVEPLAQHLIKHSHSDPHWEKRQGKVVAYEQGSLYGLILYSGRKTDYGTVDGRHARELFIRGALVHGEMIGKLAFLDHNRAVSEKVLKLEAKSRRRDILADEDTLFTRFDRIVPADINSVRRFERWYRDADAPLQQAFFLQQSDYMQHEAADVTAGQYPPSMTVQGINIRLNYHFEPGHADDGITATIPLAALNQLEAHWFEWLIPGLLQEKITALIKSLPKPLRRNFVPAPDFARACAEALQPQAAPLSEKIAEHLYKMTGVEIKPADWQSQQLPAHLQMNFRIITADGNTIACGRDLQQIRRQIGHRAETQFSRLSLKTLEKQHLVDWDFGDLPDSVELEQQGVLLKGYPALCYENDSIHLRLLDTQTKADAAHHEGTLQLFLKRASKSIRYLEKNLPALPQLCLLYVPIGNCDELKRDIVRCSAITALFDRTAAIRRQADFQLNADWAEKQLVSIANRICSQVNETLAAYAAVRQKLNGMNALQWFAALADIREQLSELIYSGFISATPGAQLQHLPRYLSALKLRLEKLEQNPQRDRQLAAEIQPLWEQYKSRLLHANSQQNTRLQHCRWLLEEFRVSLFAQTLGTAEPVSAKRLQNALRAAEP